MRIWVAAGCALMLAGGCTAPKPNFADGAVMEMDGGLDAGEPDAGPEDGGEPDAGEPDSGPPDAGPPDGGPIDAGPPDAGPCPEGFEECDGDPAIRCEADLSLVAHCGACDVVCDDGDRCVDGACRPPRVEQLALGQNFSCALLTATPGSGGPVVCWGRDHRGQLGDGRTTSDDSENRPEPAPVVGATDCYAVFAGASAACAVCGPERQAVCWGLNNPSRFGPFGASGETPTPQALTFVASPAPLLALDQYNHLCARTADAVYCSGRNRQGELGWGDSGTSSVALGAVEGLPAFTPLSVATGNSTGNGFTLVAMSNRRAYCFGQSNDSECGGPPVTSVSTPTEVPGLAGVVQVAAGHDFGCALDLAGDVHCWGANGSGQIGDGAIGGTVAMPSPVMGLPVPIGRIAANGQTVLAVSADQHEVYGWGWNNQKMLGRGPAAPDEYATAVTVISDPEAIFEAALGTSHLCVIRRRVGMDDQVLCAGSNSRFELGAASVSDPTRLGVIPFVP